MMSAALGDGPGDTMTEVVPTDADPGADEYTLLHEASPLSKPGFCRRFEFASCVTTMTAPRTWINPVRAVAALFAPTSTDTWFPAGAALIHESLATGDHVQPPVTLTLTVACPPAEGNESDAGATVDEHRSGEAARRFDAAPAVDATMTMRRRGRARVRIG